jgi:hypothetical protein
MHIDRYVKTILTIIALELLWIGLKDGAPPVVAQAQVAPTPVIIRGIEIAGPESGWLPVAVVGSYKRVPASARDAVDPLTTAITADRALKMETDRPIDVTVQGPVKVEADRPLRIESVPFTLQKGPGE